MFGAKRRRRSGGGDDVSVEMSSLIDCVFLLLIFFLVTTMMKKLEKQIPVEMPSGNASVASRAEADIRVIGINRSGEYLISTGGRSREDGNYRFQHLKDIDAQIERFARKPESTVRIYADSETPFQKVIDLMDKLQIKGCTHTDVRMIDYGGANRVRGEDLDK